ncbi:hypothetical protein PENCOP_c006G08348 [Penicillium coprophilum]|uniref:HMA domain-containing protein n=1 Tax=Penicillium coprophilum TaxID=36646 RepID=A0A1V6UPN0_9EURO|nr:hypothetical protein PENCOP_c006G08348 [Penicillium coprophilum]
MECPLINSPACAVLSCQSHNSRSGPSQYKPKQLSHKCRKYGSGWKREEKYALNSLAEASFDDSPIASSRNIQIYIYIPTVVSRFLPLPLYPSLPTIKTMASQQYKFNVQMGCGGCSSTIKEAVQALDGVQNYSISLEEQTVSVVAKPSLSYETVLEAIKAKGKNVRSGEVDGVSQAA